MCKSTSIIGLRRLRCVSQFVCCVIGIYTGGHLFVLITAESYMEHSAVGGVLEFFHSGGSPGR